MTFAEQALERLERYEGQEEWNDCIEGEGYDEFATADVDPTFHNEVAVYTDGSRLEYIESEHCWTVAK